MLRAAVAATGAVAMVRLGTAAAPMQMAAIAEATAALAVLAVMWLLMFLVTSPAIIFPSGSCSSLHNVRKAGFGLLSVREGLPIAR
jgi:hypothetical protein